MAWLGQSGRRTQQVAPYVCHLTSRGQSGEQHFKKIGGRACKPDSIMQKFGKFPKVFKLGITICHYMVYENIC